MESLPLLPGYNFTGEDSSLKVHKRLQKFKFINGFPVCHDHSYNCECISDPGYDPELTYGHKKRVDRPRFQPHYVLYQHKVLSFEAYFKIGIFGSPDEYFRVRRVFINYYLEDDTMSVMEPKILNCGFPQGKLVKRHKIPNPSKGGRCYSWKDLNVGMDVEIYGIVYRTTSCDAFTREFLNSQGVDVNEFEPVPPDPYTVNRMIKRQNELPQPTSGPSLADDARYCFLEYDRMVLYFKAMYDDNRNYQIYYFLTDNTIAVYEKLPRIEGGRNRRILRRTKVPKNPYDVSITYPGAYREKSDEDIREYYAPKDFIIGETVFIFGRRLLLYDCDPFTRTYYCKFLGIEQPSAIHIECDEECPPMPEKCPDYPDEHATDLVRQLYNFPRRLTYTAVLDTIRPEDEDVKFTIEYGLHDGSIRIVELPKDNSGRRGGNFLDWNRVRKPGTNEFYTPEDFYIGAKLEIFGRYFVITGTDLYTYKYMLSNPEKFSLDLKINVREYLRKQGLLNDMECFERRNDEVEAVEEKPVVICDTEIKKPSDELTRQGTGSNDCDRSKEEESRDQGYIYEKKELLNNDDLRKNCKEWDKEVKFEENTCDRQMRSDCECRDDRPEKEATTCKDNNELDLVCE